MNVKTLTPEQVRARLDQGALLVCAYEELEKCHDKALAGSLALTDLRRQEERLNLERELIFYCA